MCHMNHSYLLSAELQICLFNQAGEEDYFRDYEGMAKYQ